MWRRLPPDHALDRETVNGIITTLMRIDANVQRLLVLTEDDDGEEEDEG